ILATHPRPIMLAAAPMIWGLIGGSAAFLLNVPQDWGLIVAALVWIAWYFANLRASRPGAES
ncbi:MAG: DUF6064 family protein, partial [Woeseiaceae bacterium]|nr:DUF6064 family protein [Woeseiaceae bacterium]